MRVPELAFLGLERALAQPLCPVCRVVRQAEERYIWTMLYERGLDPESRKAFDASRGFCRGHASLAAVIVRQREFLRGASLASWYESAVATYLERLEDRRTGPASRPPRRGALHAPWGRAAGGPTCPTCRVMGSRATSEIKALIRMLQQDAYRGDYAQSDGLCVPHFAAALALGDHPFLREDHRARMEQLGRRLRGLQRKQAYDVPEEPTDQERRSWHEALWRFTGVAWDHLLVKA